MPPDTEPTIESQLVALLGQHLEAQTRAINALSTRLDRVMERVDRVMERADVVSARILYVALASLLLAGGAIGASVYLRLPDGTTVGTGPAVEQAEEAGR